MLPIAVKINATPKTSGIYDPAALTQPKDQASDTGRQTERRAHPAVGHPQLQSLGPAHEQPHQIGDQQATQHTETIAPAPPS